MNSYKTCILIVFTLLFISCKKKEWRGEGDMERENLVIGNEKRCYWVYKPKNYSSNKQYPLVIALHGRYGTGKNAAKMMKLNKLADQKEIIVLYPDGYKKSWNDDRVHGPAAENSIDDVAFIIELIQQTTKDYNVNPKKVYATGMSNGGFMTLSLACRLSDKIAAYATVTGSMAENPESWCFPTHKTPVLLFAGTEDPLVPYNGGEVSGGSSCTGFDEVLNFWVQHNLCDITLKDSTFQNNNLTDGTSVQIVSYHHCESQSEVLFTELLMEDILGREEDSI